VELLSKIEELLDRAPQPVKLRIPYDKSGLLDQLHSEGAVRATEYFDGYIEVEAVLNSATYGKMSRFIVDNQPFHDTD
jgi:50S ribosomal subunit-associated GTPase HflX